MERNTLPSNNLGSRSLGLTASPDREHSPAQGQIGSGMSVKQVKSKANKEALQSLIAKAGNLEDKARLKDFVIQHVPSGKHFNLVFSTLNSSKAISLNDVATLYADNKDAADTAYMSIVRDESVDYFLRRDAASKINNTDKKDEAHCHLIKTCDPSNEIRIGTLLDKISDKSKKQQVCYELLPHVLGNFSFPKILNVLQNDPNFESILYRHIEEEIREKHVYNANVLSCIKDPILREKLKALLSPSISEIKKPASSVKEFKEKLESIRGLTKELIEEKEDLYLHVIKVASVPIPDKMRSIKDCLSKAEKRDEAYVYLVKLKNDIGFRRQFINFIQNQKLKQELLLEIIQDPTEDTIFRFDLCCMLSDSAFKNNELKAAFTNDKSLMLAMQSAIAEIKKPASSDNEFTKKLEAIQKLPILSTEEKEDLYLHVIKNASSTLAISKKITALEKYIVEPEKKDAGYVQLAKLKDQNTYCRTKALKAIHDQYIQQQLLASIIEDTTEKIHFRMELCSIINDKEQKIHYYTALAKDENLSFLDRTQAALQLEVSGVRDALLTTFIQSLDPKELQKNLNLIKALSDEALDFKEELLQQVIQLSLKDVTSNPMLDPMGDPMGGHDDPAMMAVNPSFSFDAFESIKTPALIRSLAEELMQHPGINSNVSLYKALIKHDLPELVVNVMNTSIDGLEGEALEGAKKMKLAAATALHNFDTENIDALMTIIGIEAEGKDSPYALYATVLEKSKESVALEDVLAKKQEQLASTLANGQKVCLSAGAYALPAVMDAGWEKSFEGVDFAYFTGVIQSVFKDCCAEIERGLNKTDDIADIERLKKAINENKTLEGEYLKYFNEDGRSVLQNALNTQNTSSSHGNKMKAIALHIDKLRQEGKTADALTKLAELRENMQTCKGGDQQAIETAYMNIQLSENQPTRNDEQGLSVERTMLKGATQKVLNILYKIRLNWVLENTYEFRNGQKYVQYSPEASGESFPEKLNRLLSHPCLKDSRTFGNTHIGLAITSLVGDILGLRAAGHPSFDPNCVSAKPFIADAKTTKANIAEAFTDTFIFKNTWEAIAQELWDSLAATSALPISKEKLFTDLECTQQADLSALSPQDPMASGVLAFLGSIHEAKEALANTTHKGQEDKQENIKLTIKQDILKLMDKKECYYEDTFGDVNDIILYTGFSKEALVRILQELDLLKVLP